MDRLIRNSILLFISLLSFYGTAQLGYLGKRVGLEVGLGTNISVVNGSSSPFHNYEIGNKLLLPKLSVGLHRESRKGKSVHWQTVFHPLPNSYISSFNEEISAEVLSTQYDTVMTRSNNLQVSLGFRRYRELSPLGFYVEFALKGNIVFNKSLYQSELRTTYFDQNYFESARSYNTENGVEIIPEVGLSIGTTYPLKDALLLDYGVKLNAVFGTFRDKEYVENELPEPSSLHRIASSRKLLATNLIELYVNIILFP